MPDVSAPPPWSTTLVGLLSALLGLAAGAAAVTHPLRLAITGLTMLLCVPLVAAWLRRRPIDPIEPLWPFLLCYAITYAVKPLVDARGGRTYDWFEFDTSQATLAVLVAAAALFLIYIGYFSQAYRVVLPLLPATRRDPEPWRGRLASLALTMGGVVGLALIVRSIGPDFSVREASSGAYRGQAVTAAYGHGYLTILCTSAAFAPALQTAIALRTGRAFDRVLALMVSGLVLTVLVVLYSRQLILQAVVMLLVVAYCRGRILSRRAILAAGAAILILGGALGLRLRTSHIGPLEAFAFLGHTFDSFEFLSSALTRLSPVGHFAGLSLVEDAVFTFIPRAIFPEKPTVFGIVRIQNYVAPSFSHWSVSKATFPPGFLVEGYANLGVLGIGLISLAYGLCLRLAREWFWPRRDMLYPMLVYGGLVLNMTGVFRSAAQTLLQTAVYGTMLYLLLYGRIPVKRQARDLAPTVRP